MNNKQKEKILENVKLKISISNFEKEEKKSMNIKEKFIIKNIGIAACVLISMTGVVFAGSKVIENIWKTPEKIENISDEVTEESKEENITEEQAKEKAINKLKEIGLNTNIVETRHYKDIDSNKITYCFITEDKYSISFNGQTGEFSEIWNNSGNTQDINVTITEDEAKEVAMKYYKLFGFKEGEYEITRIWSNNKNGSGEGPGYKIDIIFSKKYGDIYNPYESISTAIESKNKDFDYFRVQNIPFDNNETIITEDEAIQIALKEDEKIETNKIIETKAKKMIVKMNADAYERINNKEKYYEAMQTPGYPTEERNFYKVEDRIRNAWVVVITYEDTYDGDIKKRYTEGQYSYFVDCTTGEIIGGDAMDYTYQSR